MGSKRVLLGLLFLVILVSSSRLSYLAFYTVAAAFAVCVWGGGRAFDRVRIERRLSGTKAFVGQDVAVTVRAIGTSRIPLGWLSVSAAAPPNLSVTGPLSKAALVAGRGELTLRYQVAGIQRGYYRLGAIRLCGSDPLGWNPRDRVARDTGDALVVYPPITPLSAVPLPDVRPFGSRRDHLRAHEDPSRLAGIRDYQPGDILRRIHWKASANRGKLQVKEMSPTVTTEGLILLNLGEAEYSPGTWTALGELAIETAASLVVHLVRLGAVVGLATNGQDPEQPRADPLVLPSAAGTGQAEAALTLLAKVAVAPGPDFTGLARTYGRGAAWGACLFVVTPVWSPDLSMLARALRRSGRSVVPMLVEPDGATLESGRASGLSVLTVRRDRERGGVLVGR